MITGRLVHDPVQDRYQVVDKAGEVQHLGLHCGECLEVVVDGEWVQGRIELDGRGWYIVGTPYAGDLGNLAVRMGR